jgi:hypothetical protein
MTAMSVPSSFGDVCALAPEVQERLLTTGAPMERLWSAWAIGMATQGDAAARIEAAAFAEPHPGLRRHFVVVLAGMSRRAALEALALHDPDERVRASALQYLARLAVATPELWPLLATRLGEEPSADGRRVLLESAPERPLAVLAEAVAARILDDDPQVSAEAHELLARWSRHDMSLRALLWRSASRVPRIGDPDAMVRERLLREWTATDGIAAVLRELVDADNVAAALEALEMLRPRAVADWSAVAPLAMAGGEHASEAILYAMADRLGEVPALYLLEHAVAQERLTDWNVAASLADQLPGVAPDAVAPTLRRALPGALLEVDEAIGYMRARLAEVDEGEELWEPELPALDDLTRLRAELERLALR